MLSLRNSVGGGLLAGAVAPKPKEGVAALLLVAAAVDRPKAGAEAGVEVEAPAGLVSKLKPVVEAPVLAPPPRLKPGRTREGSL